LQGASHWTLSSGSSFPRVIFALRAIGPGSARLAWFHNEPEQSTRRR